jgi:hypothetical protein
MAKTARITLRLTEEALERLDAVAAERGCSRAQAVMDLLDNPKPPLEAPSRERALFLLAESAEAGSVTARVALARLLAPSAEQPQRASDDPFDAAAEQRLRVVRGAD